MRMIVGNLIEKVKGARTNIVKKEKENWRDISNISTPLTAHQIYLRIYEMTHRSSPYILCIQRFSGFTSSPECLPSTDYSALNRQERLLIGWCHVLQILDHQHIQIMFHNRLNMNYYLYVRILSSDMEMDFIPFSLQFIPETILMVVYIQYKLLDYQIDLLYKINCIIRTNYICLLFYWV